MRLTCAEARDMASNMLDHDLAPHLEAAVKEHVRTCATCPGLFRAMVGLHDYLNGLEAASTPNPDLLERLRAKLQSQ
ncbi:MAG: hypothetical protein ACYDAL_11465 [Candidatus Dormibacteraceae bacterium]